MDCSPPGSSVHGIFKARIVEWVAISFSNMYTHTHIYIQDLFALQEDLTTLQVNYTLKIFENIKYKMNSFPKTNLNVMEDCY